MLVSRLVDHLPYYRQESINALSNVHTPRSTLASWSDQGRDALQPLFDVHREFILQSSVLHADGTPVRLLDPGEGKTRRAYVWAYAGSKFDPLPGVACDFCLGRGGKYAVAFLGDWCGTLVRDEFIGNNQNLVALEAVQRIALIFRIERESHSLSIEERLAVRQSLSKQLWKEMHVWLQFEHARVPDGRGITAAIDYSLNHRAALTEHVNNGDVAADNNHYENQMRPWALGRKSWLFAGSELAGRRTGVVMSLTQSPN